MIIQLFINNVLQTTGFQIKLVLWIIISMFSGSALAQVAVVEEAEEQWVYGGTTQALKIVIRNSSAEEYHGVLCYRLFQCNSSVVAPVANGTAKNLHLLAGQTVIEEVQIELPLLRAENAFIIQWQTDKKNIGLTRLIAFPTNIWQQLDSIIEKSSMGIWDRTGKLQALFSSRAVPYTDLEKEGAESFTGQLTIFNDVPKDSEWRENSRILLKRGISEIFIEGIPDKSPIAMSMTPNFEIQVIGNARLINVRKSFLPDWSQSQTQLRLLRLAEISVMSQNSKK